MERKTPLYDVHVEEGGKIVPFAGYLLPVQYGTGVIQEHMAVRQQAGLFDVSHMGEILFTGPTALDTINHLLTNDFTSLADGRVRYSPMCNGQGGVVDDLLVYRVKEGCYLLVVNAANKDKDFQWMQTHQLPVAQFTDLSDTVSQLALQGPLAGEILAKLASPADIPGKYYSFVPRGTVAGVPCLISKTGYTGDAGRTLVTCAERGVMRMIAVTLHDGSDWADHAALYDYGFSAYALSSGAKKGEAYGSVSVDGQSVSAVAAESFRYPTAENEALSVRAELPQTVSAPVRKGQTFGTLIISCGETEVGRVDLVSARSVQAQETKSETSKNKSLAEKLWQFLSAK